MAYQFRKFKRVHRERIVAEHEHPRVGHAARKPRVSVKVRHKFLHCDPIRDACFCDDLSYVPFRFIRGTIKAGS